MIGLNGSLSIAEQALSAQYAGLSVTNNNIANASTAGYSRQVVQLSAVAYAQNGSSVDAGVVYQGYTSVRDNVLNLAIDAKTSDQSSLTAQNSTLSQINSDFSGTTSGIGADLSSLFSSVSALSTSPTSSSLRQAVLAAATQLTGSFHQGAASLSTATASADQQVTQQVAEVNQLTSQIAQLNGQISQVQSGESGDLEDQRDTLMTQLSQLINVSSTQTDTTPTVTTANGSPLVVGDSAYALQVATGSDGNAHVIDTQGQDITSKITGGSLGGAITLRDTTLPQFAQQLNSLATQFAGAMNSAQASGYDLTGSAGAPMFSIPSNGTSAAAGISLALTDGSQIAISSGGTQGDSGNLQSLLNVQSNMLPSGATPTDTYSNLVGAIGSAGSTVSTTLSATTTSLNQLTSHRDSQSGVSLDEESVNLIRYQQAYTAAAKVISTLDNLYSVIMNMTSVTN